MKKKIAVFFGGKLSNHLVEFKRASRELGISLSLISYNRIYFDTENNQLKIRGGISKSTMEEREIKLSDFGLLFFRTTGKHWEMVNLIVEEAKKLEILIVDPMVLEGKNSMALKAWQMKKLTENGIKVPRSLFGSLWFLYDFQKREENQRKFVYPVILKGSSGDRGSRVFKANNLGELEVLVRQWRRSEIEEGRRYMLQEYLENSGDYRVFVLGNKVIGAMKRTRQEATEFRNNFSMGGKVEVAKLPEEIEKLCVKAAEVCGLMVAGVDVVFENDNMDKPVIWEVNKGPQFKGLMQATGIDVPKEIVKYLYSLVINSQNKS